MTHGKVAWDPHKEFKKIIRAKRTKDTKGHNDETYKRFKEGCIITSEEWRKALTKAALLVKKHGIEYIALFDRVEREYKQALDIEKSIDKIDFYANVPNENHVYQAPKA